MLLPYHLKEGLEAGCDEAGRGCLAGPVFAAAVVLPKNFKHPLLNDSKKLTPRLRMQMRILIEEAAIAFGVAQLDAEEIDEHNILQASFLAMHKSILSLKVRPDRLLIDGHMFKALDGFEHHCMVKGDARYSSIAAASILAKTYRDDCMLQLHRLHPAYAWDKNKGYPTVDHRRAIKLHGITKFHRKSFRLLPDSDDI